MFEVRTRAARCEGSFKALYGKINGKLLAPELRMSVALLDHRATRDDQFVLCNTARRNDEPMIRRCKWGPLNFDPIIANLYYSEFS